MARLARMDVGPSSYSSRTSYSTRDISVEEALKLVISGEMGSYDLYSQAPKQVKELLDEISAALLKANTFQNLTRKQQNKVCETLLVFQKPIEELLQEIADGKMDGDLFYSLASQDLRDALNKASRDIFKMAFVSLKKHKQGKVCRQLLSPHFFSLQEALHLVARGDLEGRTFYDHFPHEVRDVLDTISQALFHKTFATLNKKEHSEVCGILLNVAPVPVVDSNTHSRTGIVQRLKNFIGWS